MTNTTPRTGIDEERVAGMVARAIEHHRAHIRRQVAEEIAAALEAAGDPTGAHLAREIGAADA